MGGAVDAAREPAHHGDAAGREIGGKSLRHRHAVGRRRARAHDGDGEGVVLGERSAHVQSPGRCLDLAQIGGIRRVSERNLPRHAACLHPDTLVCGAHELVRRVDGVKISIAESRGRPVKPPNESRRASRREACGPAGPRRFWEIA